jgi:hypothetical protein
MSDLLIEKNTQYGNAILRSPNVFSNTTPLQKIADRLDDKLSRVMSGQEDDPEDAKTDIIGYLLLEKAIRALTEQEEVPKASAAKATPAKKAKKAPTKKAKAQEAVKEVLETAEPTGDSTGPVPGAKTEADDLKQVDASDILASLGEIPTAEAAPESDLQKIAQAGGTLGLL